MAAQPRQSRDDMSDTLAQIASDAGRSEFFALLRRIEETDGRRFGAGGGPENEPARLGQHIRLSFATRDVESVSVDGDQTQVSTNALGLLGPEGPMPLFMTRWVMARLSNRWFAGDSDGVTSDTAFRDFLDVLQHRLIALYWRAWADAQSEVQAGRGDGRTPAIIASLAGLGLPGTRDPDHDKAKLAHATKLAVRTQSPERLVSYLEDVVGAPVSLNEFVGHWDEIPRHQQSRLGMAYSTLGGAVVVGERCFSRQHRAELRFGPLSFQQFKELLEDPKKRTAIRHAILFANGHDITFDIRLVLDRAEVPAARLGGCQLGRTAWILPKRDRDADEVTFNLEDAA